RDAEEQSLALLWVRCRRDGDRPGDALAPGLLPPCVRAALEGAPCLGRGRRQLCGRFGAEALAGQAPPGAVLCVETRCRPGRERSAVARSGDRVLSHNAAREPGGAEVSRGPRPW